MRLIITVVIYFLSISIMKAVLPEASYMYLSVVASFIVSVTLFMSKTENDRDFGLFFLGINLSQVYTQYEMDSIGKDKILEEISKSWVETNDKVWLSIVILGFVTYAMRNMFKPKIKDETP